ncbi:MAG TPA: pirin family protein, partial [Burkholderiales bacterium]|nr:pirin family protein [Burkholderiales bacterium]
ILPGDVQRMSAGTGVQHSEYNGDPARITHFLQIWILPRSAGIKPSYEQKHFAAEEKRGRLRVVVSSDGREGSVAMHQDALMLAGLFDGDERADYEIAAGRKGYVHVARGGLTVNGQALGAGDALKMDSGVIRLEGGSGAEVLVFDLPP